jgi:hypothetical protein
MNSKIKKLNKSLNEQFGIEINFDASRDHLVDVMTHYGEKKKSLAMEGRLDAEYSKSVLISESIKLYLKEIAPKRTRRSK